jgi:adenylosuccinate lyase
MPPVTFPSLGSVIVFGVAMASFLTPMLDRIHRLETSAEVLNVKLSNIEANTSKLSTAFERFAAQNPRGGPTPSH